MASIKIGHYGSASQRRSGGAWVLDENGQFINKSIRSNQVYCGMEIETYFNSLRRGIQPGQTLNGFDEITTELVNIDVDGSLRDDYGGDLQGFEIITNVMSFDACKALLKLEDMRAILEASNETAHNGIHIHASKTSAYNRETGIRLIAMMTKLGPQLAELTRSTSYAKWYHDEYSEDAMERACNPNHPEHRSYYNMLVGNGHDTQRYHCLNLNNSATCEFRFFNFTNDAKRLERYLNFTKSIMKLAYDLTLLDGLTILLDDAISFNLDVDWNVSIRLD